MAIETLNDVFLHTTGIRRSAAFIHKQNGQWVEIGLDEFARTVRHFSGGLRSLGVRKDDRVAILSENRPEWTIADFAILAANAVSVPVYSTLLSWQIEYILKDSETVAVVLSDQSQLEKILEIRGNCPALREIISMNPLSGTASGVRSWSDVVKEGEALEKSEGPDAFGKLLHQRKPSDLATLVYTSGTTGNPKGAMLTHGNITSNVKSAIDPFEMIGGDVAMNILPLSHILERMVDFSYLYKGATIAYAEDVAKVAENLQEVKPHFFAGVPRLFEKMHGRVREAVSQAPPLRQKIFNWAVSVAAQRLPYRVERTKMPPFLAIKSAIADKLAFGKINQRLGGRVRFVISGGAPLSPDLAAFFIGAGIDIYEGYGLTETSPVIAVNTPDARRIGTVGKPIPGIEVKIAEDGEILTRGPHVMRGYFNDEEATRKAIDSEGWFSTGDIGFIDADGFLKITDRKKDIIVNAYGKNIAPQPLENMLKSSPYIGTPVLIGDRRQFLAALIVPNFERLERDAAGMGLKFASAEEMVQDERVRAIVGREIDAFNEKLDRQEKIRKFTLLPREFSIDENEITPSLKVKRKSIDEKYRAEIDAMYAEDPGESAR
ncbi:MAG TPA: long-chain fatty acid--CoA ligase [Thermoanaerobaculia bacterium]|nr:long-chain fatty acid--CoA ligase [Thermoanaerobaculia bacterium]